MPIGRQNNSTSLAANDSGQSSITIPAAPFIVAVLSIIALILTGTVLLINNHAFKMLPSKAEAVQKQGNEPSFYNSKVAEDIVRAERPGAITKPLKVTPYLVAIDTNSQQLRYKFPTDQSLGRIEWQFFAPHGQAQMRQCEARGFVSIPAGALLSIEPGAALMTEPELFSGFGATELDGIWLGSPYDWNDKHIALISRLTGLRTLSLNHANVTDSCIADLNKLTRLRHLRAEFTCFTGQGLCRLKRLPELEALAYSGPGCVPFLRKMANSKSVKELKLKSCDLVDDDMKILSTIPNLTTLDLSRNPGLTDRGISCLEGLKNIRELYIDDTSVSPGCIKTLKHLSLRTLKIGSNNWTREQLVTLNDALPGCHIVKVGVGLSKTLVPAKESSLLNDVKQRDQVSEPEWQQIVRGHE